MNSALLDSYLKHEWVVLPVGELADDNSAYNIYRAGTPASAGKIAQVPAGTGKPSRELALVIAAAPDLMRRLMQCQYVLEEAVQIIRQYNKEDIRIWHC